MKRVLPAAFAAMLLVSAASAQEPDDKEEKEGDLRAWGFSVAAGASFFGFSGPRSALDAPLKLRFAGNPFRAGFLAGAEGVYRPKSRHSISLGAYYEQRVSGVRTADLRYAQLLFPAFHAASARKGWYRAVFPETSLALHCADLPLTYRYRAAELFYVGAGLDAALLFPEKLRYRTLGLPGSASLAGGIARADAAVRILAGIESRSAFFEVAASAGFVELDSWGGARRSMRIHALVGYRT